MPDPLQRALVALEGLSQAPVAAGFQPAAQAVVDVLKRRGVLDPGDLAARLAGARLPPAALAPLGAWWSGNPARVVEEATRASGGDAEAVAVALDVARAFESGDRDAQIAAVAARCGGLEARPHD